MDVLRQFLPYKNGVASAKTFWRVFDFLNSQSFADRFAAWVAALIGSVMPLDDFHRQVAADASVDLDIISHGFLSPFSHRLWITAAISRSTPRVR
jgi:hypothetical protein